MWLSICTYWPGTHIIHVFVPIYIIYTFVRGYFLVKVEYSLHAANFARSNATLGACDDSAGIFHLRYEI